MRLDKSSKRWVLFKRWGGGGMTFSETKRKRKKKERKKEKLEKGEILMRLASPWRNWAPESKKPWVM